MKTKILSRSLGVFLSVLLVAFLIAPAGVVAGEATVELGTAADFAVLAGQTVTNTGPSVIGGDAGGNVGVSPGSAIVGFPPGVINDGVIHAADAVALQAQADLTIAYLDAANRPSDANLSGQDLGGMTLTSGVYTFTSSAQLTGTLTLDAEGDPDAAFIFQISSTLITAPNSTVELINGAVYCRVFWQVGSSATLGTGSDFIGHIFALTTITANTGASVMGQLLARNGAVTLDTNEISNGPCAAPTLSPTPSVTTTSATTATPTSTPAAPTTAGPASTTALTTTTTTATGDELPDTGETNYFVIAGMLIIGLASGLIFYLRRSRAR